MQEHGTLLQMKALLSAVDSRKLIGRDFRWQEGFFPAMLQRAAAATCPAIAALCIDICRLIKRISKGTSTTGQSTNVATSLSIGSTGQETAITLKEVCLDMLHESDALYTRQASSGQDRTRQRRSLQCLLMRPVLDESAAACLRLLTDPDLETNDVSCLQRSPTCPDAELPADPAHDRASSWLQSASKQVQRAVQDGSGIARSNRSEIETTNKALASFPGMLQRIDTEGLGVARQFLVSVWQAVRPSEPSHKRLAAQQAVQGSGQLCAFRVISLPPP